MILFCVFSLLAYAVYLRGHRRFHFAKESLFLFLISLYFFYYYQIPWRYFPFFLMSLCLGLGLIFVSQSYYLENYAKKQAFLDWLLSFSSYYREHHALYRCFEDLEKEVPSSLFPEWNVFKEKLQKGASLSTALSSFSKHYLVMNMATVLEHDQAYGDRHVDEHLLSLEADLLALKFQLKDYDTRLRKYLRQVLIVLLLALLIAALSYQMMGSVDVLRLGKREFRLYRFFLQSNFLIYVIAHRLCWEDLFLKEENLEVR